MKAMDEAPRKRYRELCSREESIPIFCRDWWLDAVCGLDAWNAVIVEKGQEIIGALPYCVTRGLFGLPQIVMPKLTQHNGIWIRYQSNQDYIRRLSYEKEVINSVIRQIDDLAPAYFSQHFHYSMTNWLPFLWKGFQQTTRYTYVIEDLADVEKVFDNFERDKRTWIRKAGRILKTGYDIPAKDFYEIHKQALAKQGGAITYPLSIFDRIFTATYQRGQGKSIYCEDAQGKILGALFVIWDEKSANLLISAYDPDHRSNGLGALLTWEAIRYVSSRTRKCDFTGSIVETYERSYRAFGGKQKPYFNIRKTYSPLYMMHDGWQNLAKGMKLGMRQMIGTGKAVRQDAASKAHKGMEDQGHQDGIAG